MPNIALHRSLQVPADPAADALGELLRAIAHQEGPWRGFSLHISLGDLRLPDVGYVAVPIRLSVIKKEARVFDIAFNSASLPAAFPGFKGSMNVVPGSLGECALSLQGVYELPMHFFGKLLDAALTPHIAERSLENFIDEIGAACEARVNQREADFARYQFYARSLS
jgi:hypothetical protein